MPEESEILPLRFYITKGSFREEMKSNALQKVVKKKKKSRIHHGDLKNAVIAAATELITKKGSVDFTVREVAQGIGVSHVAIFNHFDDKPSIVAEIAKNGFRNLIHAMHSNSDQNSSVLQCTKAYLEFGLEHPGEFRAMFHPSIKPFTKYSGLAEVALEAFDVLANEMHHIRPDAPKELSLAVWGTVHGITSLALDNQIAGVFNTSQRTALHIARHSLSLVITDLTRSCSTEARSKNRTVN